jgi:hypothetical protein
MPERPATPVLLRVFVTMVEEIDGDLPVTLGVAGLALTGRLISYRRYLANVADDFHAARNEGSDMMARAFKIAAAEAPAKGVGDVFFHLAEARVLDAHVTWPRDGTYIEGLISSVDWIAAGTVHPDSSP